MESVKTTRPITRPLLSEEWSSQRAGAWTHAWVTEDRIQWPSLPPNNSASDPAEPSRWCLSSALSWLRRLPLGNSKLLKALQRTPLLWRFNRDLAQDTGRSRFLLLVLFNIATSLLPIANVLLLKNLMDMAQRVANRKPVKLSLVMLLLLARVTSQGLSKWLRKWCHNNEERIGARFILIAEHRLLRAHCALNDEELNKSENQAQLELLEELTKPGWERRSFNPLTVVTTLQSMMSAAAQALVLVRQVNSVNGPFLGFLGTLTVLQHVLDQDTYEHYRTARHLKATTVSNNAYIRFKRAFELATAPHFRKDVTMFELQPVILKDAEEAMVELADVSTTDNDCHAWGDTTPLWTQIFLGLDNTFLNVFYVIYSSLKDPSQAIMALSDVETFESMLWQLTSNLASARGGFVAIANSLEQLDAFYGFETSPQVASELDLQPFVSRSKMSTNGVESRGIKIEFRNVTLRYSDKLDGPAALDDVSFIIEPGELVSIVGENGSGKSSVVSLLAMSQKASSGLILINDVAINEYDPAELLRAMSFTFQTTAPLPFTVKEYVALGDTANPPNDDRIRAALVAAGADKVVDGFKDGWNIYAAEGIHPYHLKLPRMDDDPLPSPQVTFTIPVVESANATDLTPVDKVDQPTADLIESETKPPPLRETWNATHIVAIRSNEGIKGDVKFPIFSATPQGLSGGQWQRISLARSLVKSVNDLLVWDEPAAALSPTAEAELFDHILSMRGSRTIVFTTHRFSVTRHADRILCFAKGKLLENGSHDELMAVKDGQYKKMWELQAKGYRDEAAKGETTVVEEEKEDAM